MVESSLLQLKNLSLSFGGLLAVNSVSLSIQEKEIWGIIGPNGAGKTTLFNILTGIYAPSRGDIIFQENNITNLTSAQRGRLGIVRTFQNIRLFKDLTVLENVLIAYHSSIVKEYSLLQCLFRFPFFSFLGGAKKVKEVEKNYKEKALRLLKKFNLESKSELLAGSLSYGDQRRLEIVRALSANPKILLLDEPAAGMNPEETEALKNLLFWIREEFSVSIILIEHDMNLVLSLCEKILVMHHGNELATGSPEAIKNNPEVIKAYLGTGTSW